MQKRAEDPKFQALKQQKKTWNKATKVFIAQLAAFRRALVGQSNKLNLPTSKLHEPIHPELISALNELSSRYELVTNEALKIIQDQNEFAKNRQQHAQQSQVAQPEVPKVASLQVESSSKLTRLWEYLKAPVSKQEHNSTRIGLLRSLAKLERNLFNFENLVLSFGDKSFIEAVKEMIQIDTQLAYISATLLSTFNLNPSAKEKAPAPGTMKPDMNSITKAEEVIKDLANLANIPGVPIDSKKGTAFDKLIIDYKHEKDSDKKVKIADQIIALHKQMLDAVNRMMGRSATSFAQLYEQLKGNTAVDDLNKLAEKFVRRYLKKKVHENFPFSQTSGNKVELANASEDSREIVQQLMNSLEEGLNPEEFLKGFISLLKHMVDVKSKMMPFQSLVAGKQVGNAFDVNVIMQMINSLPDDKQVSRINRRYDTLIDNKILNKIMQ